MKKDYFFTITVSMFCMLLFTTCQNAGDLTPDENAMLKSAQSSAVLTKTPERAYITAGSMVRILDLPSLQWVGQVDIPDGNVRMIKVIKSKRLALVTHAAGISKIDLNTNTIVSTLYFPDYLPINEQTSDVTVTPDDKTAFVSIYIKNSVAVIDVDSWTLQKIIQLPTDFYPNGIEMGYGGKYLYVVQQDGGGIAVIDVKSKEIYKILTTNASRCIELTLTPGDKNIFVACVNKQVIVIDSKDASVVKYIPVEHRCGSVDITKDGKTVYASTGSPIYGMSMIDTKTLSVTYYTDQISGRIRINSNGKLAILTGNLGIKVMKLEDLSVVPLSTGSSVDADFLLSGSN